MEQPIFLVLNCTDRFLYWLQFGILTMNTRLMLAALAIACQFPVWLVAQTDTGSDAKALPTVPAEFSIQFFAKEPLVRQLCSMAFDAKGRLFVGMGPQYRNPQPDTPGDSVVLVEDTDGDGIISRAEAQANPALADEFGALDVKRRGKLDRADLAS